MTRNDIIALAIEAGDEWASTNPKDQEFLIRFADLVAAAEREACAKVCDEREAVKSIGGQEMLASIRARGNK